MKIQVRKLLKEFFLHRNLVAMTQSIKRVLLKNLKMSQQQSIIKKLNVF